MNENDSPNLPSVSEPGVVLAEVALQPDGVRRRRSVTIREVLSWFVIISVVLFQFITNLAGFDSPEDAADRKVPIIEAEIEGKLLVYQRSLEKAASAPSAANETLEQRTGGSVQVRLARAILAAELDSPAAGIRKLEELNRDIKTANYEPTLKQERLLRVVADLLAKRQEIASLSPPQPFAWDAIPEDDRGFLQEELGWVGDLALYPPFSTDSTARNQVVGVATRTTLSLIGMLLFGLFWGISGLVAAGIVVLWLVMKGYRSRCEDQQGREVIYLETFAIWMVLLVLGQLVVGLLVALVVRQGGGGREQVLGTSMMIMPAVFLGSLLVLVWPVWNGISWKVVRQDLGWYGNPLIESVWGAFSYLAGFPVLVLGFLVTLVVVAIMSFFTASGNELAGIEVMSHPIQEELGRGGWTTWLVFFLTCVCAPIVEETFFRGVFYRYLRDASALTSTFSRMVVATAINSVIFAAIHPQGLAGIPVLATLAAILSVVREHRGSLWGPMAIHAMHNFAVTLLAVLLLS